MAKPKLLLIVNPTAGTMRSKTALFTLVDTFCRGGYQVTVHTTSARGDARQTVMDLASVHDLVVCCGGDGTLNEVIDGLQESGVTVPIGYVPAGSTNDFATSMKLSLNPQKAALAIVNGHEDFMDVGLWGGKRRFVYIASFGAFTAASYNAPQATKNALGHFAYVLEGIKELSALKSCFLRVKTADRILEGKYVFGAVCNSTSVAGLVRLNEGIVDMSDGLFEIILVREPKDISDLSKILVSLNTGDFDNDMFDFFKTSRITFQIDPAVPWSLDGEFQEGVPTVTVENRSRVINIRH